MSLGFERVDSTPWDGSITPFFRYETVEDVLASEREKRKVMKTIAVCEMRIAGDKNFQPVVPADSVWKTIDGVPRTYAERFSEQYRQFIAEDSQAAAGTPLQELHLSPAQMSLCRALNIYSIETLAQLEGPALRALGVHANDLKTKAAQWVHDRENGGAQAVRIAELERQLAEMRGQVVVAETVAEAAIEEAAHEDRLAHLTDAEIKATIKEATGETPRGNPSRETLLAMAEEAGI
ncbi:MAG: hypothetical protein ABF968_04830 [Acetobacter sp.]|uniref:hypothetical protein n=1 Tax=Acetobacter sp. TaxID=440 RepID=UPI0039ED7C31